MDGNATAMWWADGGWTMVVVVRGKERRVEVEDSERDSELINFLLSPLHHKSLPIRYPHVLHA